jgi:F-type H+-transporting ATPase subunit alpha
VLKQTDLVPAPFEEGVAVIYVATAGLLDDVPVERIGVLAAKFIEYVHNHKQKILDAIRDTKELSEESEKVLAEAVQEVKKLI